MSTAQLQLKTLNSLVMCVFSTTAYGTTRYNRAATVRVANQAGASAEAAKVYNRVVLAKGTAIGKAISLQNRIGVKIRNLGMQCRIGGIYLPVKRIVEAQNIFDDGIAELDVIREDIIAVYPELEAKVRSMLAGFANEVEVPTATQVASAFTMSMTILNQPVAVGEMSGVVDEVANRVRADSHRQAQELLREAHSDPVERLREQLIEFIDKMRNAERLHLSQFDKLRNAARDCKALNVLEIPEIDEVVRLAASAAAIPSESLTHSERVDCAVRAEKAAAKADETLAALGL